MRIKEQRKRKKRRRIGICIFLVVLMLFALAALIVVKVFTVQNVVVEGNSLYSADQIKNMVLDDDYSWNSLYVDLKYRFVDVGEVPFVDIFGVESVSILLNDYGAMERLRNSGVFSAVPRSSREEP